MNEDMYELYKSNKDFKEYVDRFRTFRNLGIFEALQFKIIQEYAKYLHEQGKDVIG